MITISLTGEVLGVTAGIKQAGFSFIKINPDGNWKFDRPGEMPAVITIKAKEALAAPLQLHQRVSIKGKMAVGVHQWEAPKKFNEKEGKKKDMENVYFLADTIEVLKS